MRQFFTTWTSSSQTKFPGNEFAKTTIERTMTVAMCRFFFNRWAGWGLLFLLMCCSYSRIGLEVYTGLHSHLCAHLLIRVMEF